MEKITKEEALKKIDELKKYVDEVDKKQEEKVVGIAIMSRFGGIKFQSTKTTFREAVIEGKADLRDADLSDADLSDADLSGADLRDADLRDADLRDADLRDADLRDADLRDADLSGADLRDAELNCAKFYGRGGTVVIKKANLEGFLGALGFKLEE